MGETEIWLRAWDRDGRMLPTSAEQSESNRQLAETEKHRAEAERLRNEKLAAKLRELGIDPDHV